ncbi:MAG: NAD(P)-dependent oxidoreductase [Myxococcota bacterium]
MRVVIAGATGAIGRPLVRQLLEAGHEVFGLTRREEGAAAIQAAGARAVVADALDRDAVIAAVVAARPDAVVNQLTALPARLDPRRISRQLAPTNRLRREGTAHLLAAAEAAGAARFLSQSVAFAHDAVAPAVVDEDAPFALAPPAPFAEGAAALRALERATRRHPGGTVLRYGFFYGPGTAFGRDGSTAEDVRRRRYPLVGDAEGIASFVHVEDAAAATIAALAGPPGTYAIVDDEPAPGHAWLPAYAEALGAPPPRRVPRWVARVLAGPMAVHWSCALAGASNARAKAALGWTPGLPTWRTGFRLALAEDAPLAGAA